MMSKPFWFTTAMTVVFAVVCYNVIKDAGVCAVLIAYMCLGVFMVGVIDIWARKGW